MKFIAFYILTMTKSVGGTLHKRSPHEKFCWPSLFRDVQHWCKSCEACQKESDKRITYEPRNPVFSYGLFEKWGVDAIGPLPQTNTRKVFIIVAIDYMTHWAEAVSTRRITAQEVGKFIFESICCRFGVPLEIVSNHGPGFRANILQELLTKLKVKHRFSSPYYPQCNGLVEKTNGILVKIIAKKVQERPKDWDKHLSTALWAYRTSFKVTTQFAPFHLVYGQEAILPIEVMIPSSRLLLRVEKDAKEQWQKRLADLHKLEFTREEALGFYIEQANKRRDQFNKQLKDKGLTKGMLVLRYDSRLDTRHDTKFLPRWEGPFIIYQRYQNGSYQLQDLSGNLHKTRENGWRFKPYLQRADPQASVEVLNERRECPSIRTQGPLDMGEFTLPLHSLFENFEAPEV